MPIDANTCPGPCNRRAREAWDAYDQAMEDHTTAMAEWRVPLRWPVEPQEPDEAVTWGDPVFCGRCARLIRAALAELDDLASLLAAVSDGHRGAGARHGKTGPAVKGASAPSPSSIGDTLDELYGALVKVEDDWRDYRGYGARPQRARNGHARRLSVTWLLDELDAILTHPGSVQFGRATLAWQRRLRALTKSDPVGDRPVRCPRCGEVRMRREDDGYFKCRVCGRLMSQEEHDREFDEQAAAQEAAELAHEAS
ncbi:hypothetical protein N5079_19700 [Planotetraspora sp. A-T 1434]|uniref:hypothetical protein n=1 Tax=Planotetraspora sp. A-T 1434 TaxID=2979219 RepID=UPI0021C1B74A|nr:hypothetical protein [Planotetraspora sp. A-T 1434]MCT9932429.1 hypothetical protein [Planotetraspora sp. A-T 1434]